jgi:hypothetical protein
MRGDRKDENRRRSRLLSSQSACRITNSGGLNGGWVEAEVAVGPLRYQPATFLGLLDEVSYLSYILIAHP